MSYGVLVDLDTLTNLKYGFLTIKNSHREVRGGKTRIICEVVCECGGTKTVALDNLRKGHVTSCGCHTTEQFILHHTKHGQINTRLYGIWTNMKTRCYNKNIPRYKNYGERGITICDEWKNDFSIFYEWAISHGYEETLTIERINVEGNYCPENCTWVTVQAQECNRTDTLYYTIDGETKCLSEWCREYKVGYARTWMRLKKGREIYEALTSPNDSRYVTRKITCE